MGHLALDLSKEIQLHIAHYIKDLPSAVNSVLLEVIYESKIDISDELRAAFSENHENYKNKIDIMPNLSNILERIISDGVVKNEFDLCEMFIQQSQILPFKNQVNIIYELSLQTEPLATEATTLMMLHSNSEVRLATSKILLNKSESISGTSLRRMIGLRNWIMKDEREVIDAAIKNARKSGVDCATWSTANIDEIKASVFDGSGVQMIIAITKENKHDKKSIIVGFLLKDGVGIREPWIFRDAKKSDFNRIVNNMMGAEKVSPPMLIRSVDREYIDKIVSHYIAVGHEANRVPELRFLEVAEVIGSTHWHGQLLNITAEINNMYHAADKKIQSVSYVEQSLIRSGQWHVNECFTESWFEDGEDTYIKMRNIIAQFEDEEEYDELIIKVIIAEILEPRRQRWLNKLFWSALWLKSCESDTNKKDQWIDFLILTKKLADGDPMYDIPFMREVARETLSAFEENLDFEV